MIASCSDETSRCPGAHVLYLLHEVMTLMFAPARAAAEAMRTACEDRDHPLANVPNSAIVAATCAQVERTIQPPGKPAFNLGVAERVVWERPFCRVLAFGPTRSRKRKLLIIAPMAGHFATHLRDTVASFLDTHRVYITDWADAKDVPLAKGGFGLSDYIDYCIDIVTALGPDLHLVSVCQSAVPVLAAIARMEEDGLMGPVSASLIGGPVDTRISPTLIDDMAHACGVDWIARHCIDTVPSGHPGHGRAVHPGFMQLAGLLSLLPYRRPGAGLLDDEYHAVMDLTAEFFLDTLRHVFLEHDLPRGALDHRGRTLNLSTIRRCRLLAIEGERDDITGIGQTRAALLLTRNLPDTSKAYHLQAEAGHYDLFDGPHFRSAIAPRVAAFIAASARTAH